MLSAVIGDFAIPYMIAPFYKGYSHTASVMSILGNPSSPVRIVYNAWLILLGILLLISSKLIFIKFFHISKGFSIAVMLILAVFAIGAGILSGIFSVNQSKDVITVASKIHGVGASIGFMLLLFAPLLLAILFFKTSDTFEGVFSLLCFIFSFVFFILFILADKPEFQNTVISFEGLWQRLTLLFMYIPFASVAVSELLLTK